MGNVAAVSPEPAGPAEPPGSRHEQHQYPGGQMGAPLLQVTAVVTDALVCQQLEIVLTFPPDRLIGHPDHVATHEPCTPPG